MATFHSFGVSFGAAARSHCPDADERRRKADEARSAPARLRDLPPAVQAWRDALSVDALEAMAVLHRLYADADFLPVAVNPADLADRLGTGADDARGRLAALVRAGAVEERPQLRGPVRYVVTLAPPGLVNRADPLAGFGGRDSANAALSRQKADREAMFRPSPRGDHLAASRDQQADLESRLGLRRRGG